MVSAGRENGQLRYRSLTSRIIGAAAIEVQGHLEPGLLQSAYEQCLVSHRFARSGKVVLELKAVKDITPVHEAQVLSYLKFSKCPVGLLFNFNALKLKDGGIRRFVR